jgi:hypothetical protein
MLEQFTRACATRLDFAKEHVKLRSDYAKLIHEEAQVLVTMFDAPEARDLAKVLDADTAPVIAAHATCLAGLAEHPVAVDKCRGLDETLGSLADRKRALIERLEKTEATSSLRQTERRIDASWTTVKENTLADVVAKVHGCL